MSDIYFKYTEIIADIKHKVNRYPDFFREKKGESTFFMGTKFNIKARLAFLNKTSRDVIFELNNRGIKITPGEFSAMINKALRTPKANSICELADKIITEWEGQK